MRDIGDGIFHLRISLLIAVSVILEFFQLFVYAVSEPSHMPVSAGNVYENIGVGFRTVRKFTGDFIRRFFQKYDFYRQSCDEQEQDAGQTAYPE